MPCQTIRSEALLSPENLLSLHHKVFSHHLVQHITHTIYISPHKHLIGPQISTANTKLPLRTASPTNTSTSIHPSFHRSSSIPCFNHSNKTHRRSHTDTGRERDSSSETNKQDEQNIATAYALPFDDGLYPDADATERE